MPLKPIRSTTNSSFLITVSSISEQNRPQATTIPAFYGIKGNKSHKRSGASIQNDGQGKI